MTKFTAASTGTLTAIVALGLGLSAQTTPAPAKAAPKPALAVAHKAAAPQPAATAPQPDLTKQYCIGCHSEKGKAGGLSLVVIRRGARRAERRGLREDHPQAAPGHDAASRRAPPGRRGALAVCDLARESKVDAAAALHPNPGPPAVPAAEPCRVRALGARSARSRRRRQRVPAARHAQRRLRQHRRRPDVLGDADGRLPARRGAHFDAGGRRPQRQPVGIHGQGAAHRVADAPRRRHAVGHPRRPRARLHVPGRRRLLVPRDAARHADRPAVRQRREPQRADRSVDQRRARRADGHRLEDDRDRQERSEPGHAARSTSRPARSTSPPRSSRSSTASSTTWSRRSTTPWRTPSTATTPASPSCRTCATSASPDRTR